MTVIDNYRRAGNFEHVESGRHFVHLSRERPESQPNLFGRQTERPAGGRGGKHVFDLEADPSAKSQRDAIERKEREFVFAFGQGNRVITYECDPGPLFSAL